jgi:hypothetical protein
MFSGQGRVGRWARRRAERGLAGHREREAELLQRPPFPIYGLDQRWTGRRWPGGWGSSDGTIDRIELGHGDPFDDGAPLVRVETLWVREGRERMTEVSAAHELAEVLWHEGAEHDVVRSAYTEDPTGSWPVVALSVDGVSMPFRLLAAGDWWATLGRIGDRYVAVKARHVGLDDVGLVTMVDPEPYLEDDGLPR